MELYPFHSAKVTGPILPPKDLLTRFILDPIADLDVAHVFAFGKPWLAAAHLLGLDDGKALPIQWATRSRQAQAFPLNQHQSLIVMTQHGYAADTAALVTELARH